MENPSLLSPAVKSKQRLMKNLILLLLFLVFGRINSAGALDASISYATFKGQETNYIEVYLYFIGETVEFVQATDSTVQAALDVVILFRQKDQIVRYDKYRLNSPEFNSASNFVDLKRYSLENGNYEIEVSVEDANQAGNAGHFQESFVMDYQDDRLELSNIELLASLNPLELGQEEHPLAKNGYYFEPLPFNFYGRGTNTLIFYAELYNSDKAVGEDFLVSFFIDDADTPGRDEAIQMTYKRRSPEAIGVLVYQMDISTLPSGNYNLIVEIRSRTKELLKTQSVLFQRSNPYLSVDQQAIAPEASLDSEFVAELSDDELRYSLKAIYMQLDKEDGEMLNTLIREKKRKAMQLYLYNFWAVQNPGDPEASYKAYMEVARKIDERYRSGFGYGFETDRGYVFMKYGAPNDIVTVEDEPSAPPYEIWFYYAFPSTNQNNVKFLFYNPSLATNGHRLLHSTARGELNNPRWEVELYRNAPNEIDGGDYIEGTRMQRNINRQARRLFESY